MKPVESLQIAEFATPPAGHALPQDTFEIRTCQRTLWISFRGDDHVQDLCTSPRRLFQSDQAYEFLLRFTCGLESEIKGETDVFGQAKTAVKNWLASNDQSPLFQNLIQSLFLKIFEDTKEIRAEYLQGIGGNTYGALSRRILAPQPHDQVLLIGAGQMSKSVAPYFTESQLTIWNRSSERLEQMHVELSHKLNQKTPSPISFISGKIALCEAIQQASIIVIATPSSASDSSSTELEEIILKQIRPDQKILHLGGQAAETTPFNKVIHFWSLTDLFYLEKEQSTVRSKQVAQALAACHHRAVLRSMARSIHIAHGWEDLALFN